MLGQLGFVPSILKVSCSGKIRSASRYLKLIKKRYSSIGRKRAEFEDKDAAVRFATEDDYRRSALYVKGIAGQTIPFSVEPFTNFDELFADSYDLLSEMSARKTPVEYERLKTEWQTLKHLWAEKAKAEKALQEFQSHAVVNEDYVPVVRSFRKELKASNDKLKELEVDTVLALLKIPTKLHKWTPVCSQSVMYSSEIIPHELTKDLVESGVVEWTESSPGGYFLKGAAAELDLDLNTYARHILEKNQFSALSGPNLLKSVIMEAAGVDLFGQDEAFLIDNSEKGREKEYRSLFLTSHPLQVFTTYFANGEYRAGVPFVKLHHSGRLYTPRATDDGLGRLFSPSQTQCVSFCIGYEDPNLTDSHLEEALAVLKEFYLALGVPYRIVIEPANTLAAFESLRFVCEVWSVSQKSYIPCGYISANNDFISKRVRCQIGQSEDKFMHLIHGSFADLTPLVACYLEHHPTEIEAFMNNERKIKKW